MNGEQDGGKYCEGDAEDMGMAAEPSDDDVDASTETRDKDV